MNTKVYDQLGEGIALITKGQRLTHIDNLSSNSIEPNYSRLSLIQGRTALSRKRSCVMAVATKV